MPRKNIHKVHGGRLGAHETRLDAVDHVLDRHTSVIENLADRSVYLRDELDDLRAIVDQHGRDITIMKYERMRQESGEY